MRGTVEQYKRIDIKFLKDKGYLKENQNIFFRLSWSSNGEPLGDISARTDLSEGKHSIRFNYRIREYGEEWSDMDYEFNLLSIPCNFGGKRWFFECGVYKNGKYCGRRVSTLFLTDKYFCCRKCAELSYESCNENKRYRSGFFRVISKEDKAYEYYKNNVKREYYAGKPTRKYQRYSKMMNSLNEHDLTGAYEVLNKLL